MKPYYADDTVTLHHGDALEVLRALPDASVDAAVTDPPYGLEFMGKDWDSFRPSSARLRARVDGRTNPAEGKSVTVTPEAYVAGLPFQRWCEAWAAECLRVLRPGGHLLAFGGTRTVHRLTTGIEDAGFEVRDGIDWIYAQGFPKSLNLGDGRGTALKPAREPIVMARKPLAGTVAANVAAHGTGALNIDPCRVPTSDADRAAINAKHAGMNVDAYERPAGTSLHLSVNPMPLVAAHAHEAGRWPSNVVLSHAPDCTDVCLPGCPVAELDRQSGTTVSRAAAPRGGRQGDGWRMKATGTEYDDQGGASRFFPVFRYEAKAASAERPRVNGVAHPTVKPLDLMRWLVRLVTPAGGVVLEPFAGSGTTAEACVLEGLRCIAIERDETYLPLITARLTKALQPALDFGAVA